MQSRKIGINYNSLAFSELLDSGTSMDDLRPVVDDESTIDDDLRSAASDDLRPSKGDDPDWFVVSRKKSKSCKKDQRMTHERATNYQRSLNIKNLAKILMSVEARNLEEDGWRFYKVLRGGETEDVFPKKNHMEYVHIPIPNEWQDRAYFCRVGEIDE